MKHPVNGLPHPPRPGACLTVGAVVTTLALVAALLPAAARAASEAGTLAIAATDDQQSAPAATTSGYTTLDLDWMDSVRARAVPVRLYLPESADAARPVPLVVFSHGIGGSRAGYSYLGRFWASQGYASLHVQHVGSDRSLWSGNPFTLVTRLQNAAQDQEAIARVHDLRFALDQLLAGPQAERIDASRIVAAGHSYGANTTLLAVGARVDRGGRTLDFRDPRFKAAIVLSAPPFYGSATPTRILSGVTVPTLHVTATDDVIRIPGYHSGADDRVAVFEAVGDRRKALAVFSGGSHSMFTDRAGTGGATLNPQVKQATRELSLAFLQQVLEGQDTRLRAWPAQFAGILARFTPPLP
jgi:predicted dienelactone hydrolase